MNEEEKVYMRKEVLMVPKNMQPSNIAGAMFSGVKLSYPSPTNEGRKMLVTIKVEKV